MLDIMTSGYDGEKVYCGYQIEYIWRQGLQRDCVVNPEQAHGITVDKKEKEPGEGNKG